MTNTIGPRHKRQGDLLFIQVLTATRSKPHPDGRVLARGEATGHCHAIEDLSHCDVFLDESGRLIIEPRKESATVLHEEHAPVPLEPELWEVRLQREYQAEGRRNVAD